MRVRAWEWGDGDGEAAGEGRFDKLGTGVAPDQPSVRPSHSARSRPTEVSYEEKRERSRKANSSVPSSRNKIRAGRKGLVFLADNLPTLKTTPWKNEGKSLVSKVFTWIA